MCAENRGVSVFYKNKQNIIRNTNSTKTRNRNNNAWGKEPKGVAYIGKVIREVMESR
jgi:hypothetical protein